MYFLKIHSKMLYCLFEQIPAPLPAGRSFFWASAVQSNRRWNTTLWNSARPITLSTTLTGKVFQIKIQHSTTPTPTLAPPPFPPPWQGCHTLCLAPEPPWKLCPEQESQHWAGDWCSLTVDCHNESVCKLRLRCCLKEWIQIIRGQIKSVLAYPVNVLSGHIEDYKKLWPECDDSN